MSATLLDRLPQLPRSLKCTQDDRSAATRELELIFGATEEPILEAEAPLQYSGSLDDAEDDVATTADAIAAANAAELAANSFYNFDY